MANMIPLPSECGHDVCLEDERTKSFLSDELGINVKETLSSDEDYMRVVFYLKCAGLYRNFKSTFAQEKQAFYLSSQENIDILFDCMWQDFQTANEKIMSPSSNDVAELEIYMQTLQIVGNDKLYQTWKDDSDRDNEAVSRTFDSKSFDACLKNFEQLHPEKYAAMEEKRLSALKEKINDKVLMNMMIDIALKKAWKKTQKKAERNNLYKIAPLTKKEKTVFANHASIKREYN